LLVAALEESNGNGLDGKEEPMSFSESEAEPKASHNLEAIYRQIISERVPV